MIISTLKLVRAKRALKSSIEFLLGPAPEGQRYDVQHMELDTEKREATFTWELQDLPKEPIVDDGQ